MKLRGWHKLSGCGYKGYIIQTTGEGLSPTTFNTIQMNDIDAEVYTASITYVGSDYRDEMSLEFELPSSSKLAKLHIKHNPTNSRNYVTLSMNGMTMANVLRMIEQSIDVILRTPAHELWISKLERMAYTTSGSPSITASAQLPSFDDYRAARRFDIKKDLVDMGRFIPPPPDSSQPRVIGKSLGEKIDEVKSGLSLSGVASSTAQVLMEAGPIGEVAKILKTEKAQNVIQKIKIWLKTH